MGANLLRAANEAYAQGMADVMMVTAGVALACALTMAVLLPSSAYGRAKPAESVDVRAESA
jgi:hypothetical protein